MNTEFQIEFNKIQDMWAELAATDYAKERIREVKVILDEKELRRELRDTTDARDMVEKLGTPPLQNVNELSEVITVVEKGDCLTPYQLERVENVLVVIERLRSYLARGKQYNNPLAYYDENLDSMDYLRDEIVRQIRNEMVDDRATKELFEIRTSMIDAENKMKQKAEQIIRSHKDCMADSFYSLRSGRVCVPVKKEYKFKVPGSVIDKSATGSTLFVEPEGVSRYFEEMELLKIDEENEVYKILYTLTAMVADATEALKENMRMMEKLDYIFSKGKLSIDLDCVEPRINLDRRIKLKEARHPLMDKAVNVPLNFSLGESSEENSRYSEEKIRGVVITGPNTGGKTVAIKTVMLACFMAQCGLHVTAKEADVCMNSNYLSDIGDGQNLSENLSTFSAHIKNVLDILKKVNRESFVIMDELGSGTDPTEGMGIAVAILEELKKSEANFLVTTHYPEVKDYAERTSGIVNARMTFNKETLRPTYKMVIGEAGESCAFYIADRLGMSRDMLSTAIEAAYGKDAAGSYEFSEKSDTEERNRNKKEASPKITKIQKKHKDTNVTTLYNIGDSVMVYPDKKIGIVCEPVDKKGVLRVQVAGKKIYINHKRVKLLVRAEELYPEDYDFSIIFDSVENRKLSHDMGRKLTEGTIVHND
ncbi:dsDNA-specific endonuclease/ATPase MutS2 [Lachnospiraceae bacterium NE2001]|nr:dsDNA-specific endonuclease/ATPase MutS2 [Lachnospiraceae bacterium NE2001]